MDGNNWRAAQAQRGGGEGGGAAAGAMDSGDWRTQLLPDSRQRIVDKIMETLKRHLPVSGQEGVQELKKIAVRFEEKMYSAATSQQDYLRMISLKMLNVEAQSQNPMTNSVQPNPASSGQNALGPERNLIRSEIEMDENNLTAAQTQGGGEGAAGAAAGDSDSGDWRTHFLPESRRRIAIKMLYRMETLKRHVPVHVQDRVQKVMEIAVKFEEKMYNAAKSQDYYLKKISLKMLKMETKYQNPWTNSLHPNTASSGLNAHGPEMTMEATSYETTSGPEDSDEEAMEEEDGNVSKEDVVEEVVVRKEQNSFVGHKGNVGVGENEESSSNEAIGRPSVFFN